MTKLPEKGLLDGTKSPETTTGEFRLAMGNLRQFLFELFGDESGDKETARQTLGIDMTRLNDGIASKADKATVEAMLEEKADKNDLSLVATTGDYNHLVNKPERSDSLEGYGILVDSTPTAGSTRPVTSEGIKNYVDTTIAAVQHGVQLFTNSGTFVVPNGVTQLYVKICGGGGGNNSTVSSPGTAGGTTTFGTYLTATGGSGAYHGAGGSPNGNSGNAYAGGEGLLCYGRGGSGSRSTNSDVSSYLGGAGGGINFGYCQVTSGQAIPVTIGGAGRNNSGVNEPQRHNPTAGCCIVYW